MILALDSRSYYTDLEWTLQCLEALEPRQTWQRRRTPTPNQAQPSQEADKSPISSTTSLQPNQSPQVVLHQTKRTLPLWTIVDTDSKLGHNIWTNDPSLCLHPTKTHPTRPHCDRWGIWTHQFTGTLAPSDPSFTNIDVRTFVSWGFVLTLEAKGAPSFGSVPRPSPLWGPGWWPLGMVWLVKSFLSR
jgi:hypothetical protein